MEEMPEAMTDKEAARLYHLPDIGVSMWSYWGVEKPGQPRLANSLAKEVSGFSSVNGAFLQREEGDGCVLLMLPSLKVTGPDEVKITSADEGLVIIAVEDGDSETWGYATKLYRLVRRIYHGRGKGGRPGQISWKTVAGWISENPELLGRFVEMLTERKLRCWEKERAGVVAILESERKWARHNALQEIRRGLARAGFKISELE